MNVTLQNRENQTVTIVNLSEQFSTNKESMFNKNTRGIDTLQQRLADMEHDYNGPAAKMTSIADMQVRVSPLRNNRLSPELIDAMQAVRA